MKKNFTNTYGVMTPIVVGLLIFCAYFVYSFSNKINMINVYNEGIRTCFFRVNQSFTAKLFSNIGSRYLTESFTSTTEECFGDTISYFEEKLKGLLEDTSEQINTLATNVHLFHQKINNLGVYPTFFVEEISEDSRFKKVFENDSVLIYEIQ